MISVQVDDETRVQFPRDMSRHLGNLPPEVWDSMRNEEFVIQRNGVTKGDAEAFVCIWRLARTPAVSAHRMHQLVKKHLRGLSILVGHMPFEPLYGMCVHYIAEELRGKSSLRISEMMGITPNSFASVL